MDHPKDVGDRTTMAVMIALRELGFAIFIPFGENTGYDLIDYFGIHCPDDNSVYLVPIEDAQVRRKGHSASIPRGTGSASRWEAAKYEIGYVTRGEPDATSDA